MDDGGRQACEGKGVRASAAYSAGMLLFYILERKGAAAAAAGCLLLVKRESGSIRHAVIAA